MTSFIQNKCLDLRKHQKQHMHNKFTLAVILSFLSIFSFGQTTSEKVDQQTDAVRKENVAKADVIVVKTNSEIFNTNNEQRKDVHQIQKLDRQQKQSNRLFRKMNRRRNLRRSFHTFQRRHSLIKGR